MAQVYPIFLSLQHYFATYKVHTGDLQPNYKNNTKAKNPTCNAFSKLMIWKYM